MLQHHQTAKWLYLMHSLHPVHQLMTWSLRIPLVNDKPELPEPEIQTGRQKARAAVMELHPPEMLAKFPEMLAKLCKGLKKGDTRIVENIPGHYAVPPGTQPDGKLSDEY